MVGANPAKGEEESQTMESQKVGARIPQKEKRSTDDGIPKSKLMPNNFQVHSSYVKNVSKRGQLVAQMLMPDLIPLESLAPPRPKMQLHMWGYRAVD
jgi:hypothetical protein